MQTPKPLAAKKSYRKRGPRVAASELEELNIESITDVTEELEEQAAPPPQTNSTQKRGTKRRAPAKKVLASKKASTYAHLLFPRSLMRKLISETSIYWVLLLFPQEQAIERLMTFCAIWKLKLEPFHFYTGRYAISFNFCK